MFASIPGCSLLVLTTLVPGTADPDLPEVVPTPVHVEDGPALPAVQEEEKKGPLSGSVNVGVISSFGNTELTKVNFNAAATYVIDEKNRVSGQFDWFYAEEKNQVTKVTTVSQRRVRGVGQYDHLFTERMYGYVRGDGTTDGPQNLQLRLILGAGVGYQFVDTKDERLSGEVGLAWNHENFKRTAVEEYVSARVAGKYFRQLSEDLKVNATVEWLPSLEDRDDHIVLGMIQGDYNLGKGFLTSLRYEFDYDSTPAAGNDKIDHRVIWSLGYTF